MATFFLGDKSKKKYEEEHGSIDKPKKRVSSTRLKDKLSKSKHKPDHFDSKIANVVSPPIGKILHNFTYFTENGIQMGIVYDLSSDVKLNNFEVRIMDVDFKILIQEKFSSIKECKGYLAKIIEVPDNSGLVKCIRDVLTKVGQLENEIFFMFKLLVDPEERKEYEIAEELNRKAYGQEHTHKRDNVSKSKHKKLSKHSEDIRSKIRNLSKKDNNNSRDEYVDETYYMGDD